MFLFISFVCLIGVTLAQSDVVDEIGEIAMRECKKVLKEKNVVADTVWHFSKTLCSDMQDATETYFSETVKFSVFPIVFNAFYIFEFLTSKIFLLLLFVYFQIDHLDIARHEKKCF